MTDAADGCDGCGESWEREARLLRCLRNREHELATFRSVWELCPDRAALAEALEALMAAGARLGALTGHMIRLTDLTTNKELAEALHKSPCTPADVTRTADVAALERDAPIGVKELLCAVRCWGAGEPYLPGILPARHPRWPDATERAIALSVCPEPEPESESEGGADAESE